jgi:hypothetical protein
MLSNGNYAQYSPQALQYFPQAVPQFSPQGGFGNPPGVHGVNPYGAHSGFGFGQEFGANFGQHQNIGNQGVGSPIVAILSQLANQIVTQGAVAQQMGALLGQLAQQVAAQTPSLYGNTALVPGGLQAGALGQSAYFAQSPYQSPYFATTPGGGYGGFTPQMQTPQVPAWAINRPTLVQ